MKVKDYKLAIQNYRHVVSIAPDELEGHQKLLEAWTAAGNTTEADKEKAVLARLAPKP